MTGRRRPEQGHLPERAWATPWRGASWGNDLDAWREQLDRLRPYRRAVAYDQRGHGGSDRPRDGVYTVEALAADLEAVADALGLKRFVLVGHSLSGAVLSAYAGAHPDLVAGPVYADAVGDFHAVPRPALEEALRGESSPSFGAAEVLEAFDRALDAFLGLPAR